MTDAAQEPDRPSDTEAAHRPDPAAADRPRTDPVEARSFDDDEAPEIAADDAGASAMAERAGKQAEAEG